MKIFLIISIFILTGCATTGEHAEVENLGDRFYGLISKEITSNSNTETDYIVVKKGETLYSIARRYQVDLNELRKVNHLSRSAVISVGQPLKIPTNKIIVQENLPQLVATPAPVAHQNTQEVQVTPYLPPMANSNKVTHKVKPGETVHRIAKNYKVSVEELRIANNVGYDFKINSGDTLIVPVKDIPQNKTQIAANKPKKETEIVAVIKPQAIKLKPLPVTKVKTEPQAMKQPKVLEIEPADLDMEPIHEFSAVVEEEAEIVADSNFIWPIRGKVISAFGTKPGGIKNDGINIAASDNSPIKAVAAGSVIYAGGGLKSYGNLVIIKHPNGYFSTYAHQKKIVAQKGDIVKQGQVIGYVGNTGNVTSPQLHFALRKGKTPINPTALLKSV